MDQLIHVLGAKYNYIVYILLMMIGLYAMIAKNNLVKKIIGMNIFQTSIILYYVSTAYKTGKAIPIVEHGHGAEAVIHSADYINPLPHVLMLTAIVVSVATLGVALSLAMKIYRQYGTLEEDDIHAQIRSKAEKE
jgi:multicomponent Na+:H+ antiporter subunit C